MASPPRNRKGAQFQPMAAEALGLSIHPTTNEVQSSPPLAAVPNSMVATAAAASASQPSSKRGSQIRQSSGGSGSIGPSSLSQEVAPSTPEFHPPSPSHTASPPQASSNFSPSSQPLLQQSPQQMPTTGGTYGWTQNRVPPPSLNATATAGPRLISDSWVPPDSDVLIPPLQPKNQQMQSPPGPPIQERDEVLQHTPPRVNGDWSARGGGGTLADAMAQRTSPTAQLLQGSGNGVRAGGVNANRPRVRGPTQSSSPVMMQAVRQAALQSSPPMQPSQPAGPVRGTPPSLQGLIAPNVNPPPPILPRANTENPAASAVAAGVRPLGGTPPNVNSYQRNNTTSPPGHRNPSTTASSTSSPPYHTGMESIQGATSYLSESSSYSALPFEYDQDDDDVQHKSPQQHYSNQPQPDPRNRTSIDSYRRDQQDSPPPIHIRSVPNQAPTSMPPPQPQVQPPQPQVQTQAVPRPGLFPTQPASAISGPGSHIRGQPARSFPVVDEFEDDEVVAVPQQLPAARPQASSSQPPPARWVSQSREREREREPEPVRAPSPPPAPPVQHPPIPLFSPQSVQAGQPAVLRDNSPRRGSSTPSPPVPLRINPEAGNRHAPEDEMDPAEPSSDSFTPKSPNVALPADHGYTYSNNNYGRLGSHNRMPQGQPYTPVDPYASYGGSLQHALFAMQMGGMPAPRGPLATFNNYGARDGFTSLGGAAAALTGKPESPYPAPPLNNTANGSSSKLGHGSYAGASGGDSGGSYNYDSSQSSQPWEGPEQISYADFVEWQRKMYSNRPDAPIPPTPQSYASPQSSNQQGFGGDQRNGMNANRENDGKNSQATNGHGFGNVPAYGNGYGPGGVLDPSMIPDRYIPSALSSYLSSPMMHNPFLPRFPPPQSLVSSPSHIPLDLGPAPLGQRRLHKKKSKRQLRGAGSGTSKGGASSSVPKTSSKLKESIQKPPTPPPAEEFPRVESTVPKDTSSEESDTDDTKKGESTRKAPVASGPAVVSETEEEEDDDDDVWLDESSEDELDAEYHSRYIQNPSKRKRKWEQKWDTMIRLFQEIDRTTDSPMVLLAAPSTSPSPKTHILISRAIQRNPGKYMPHAQTARQSFAEIAKLRRKEKADAAAAERARRAAGFEQQLAQIPFLGPRWDAGSADSGGRGSSSPGSAGFGQTMGGLEKLQDLPNLAAGGEDGLKQALSVALDSLKQMHMIYEQREERRREEQERQRQEAAGLENLFRIMAIESAANSSQGSGPAGAGSPASSSGVPSLSGKKSP